jgi:hypothetical protein
VFDLSARAAATTGQAPAEQTWPDRSLFTQTIAGLSARSAGACHPLSAQPKEMAVTTMAHPAATHVTVGVDTHGDVHVAHAKDQLGRRLDTVSVPTTPSGYRDLLAWARGPR